MLKPPRPASEAQRLEVLRSIRLLDTAAEPFYDRIVRLAAELFDVPTALVTLVDEERQWFKAQAGFDCRQTARDISFCGYAILETAPMVVLDATVDVRFFDNPLVIGKPYIRFYAGAPLVTHDGLPLGTLCILSPDTRSDFNETDRARLAALAGLVADRLDTLRSVAYLDPITQLPNLPRFVEDATRCTRTVSAECPKPTYAVLVDIYPFADINRMMIALGILSLSEAAAIAAKRLNAVLPHDLTLYRVGYARYGFFSSLPYAQIQRLAMQCVEAFDAPLIIGHSIPIDVMPHAAILPLEPTTDAFDLVSRLVAIADEARRTRAPFILGDAAMSKQAERAFIIVNSIKGAIAATGEFRLVFQPVLCLRTGIVKKLEALLRWCHPILGEISPAEFLPLVEPTALMSSLTYWVLNAALQHLHQWCDVVPNLKVAINVAASDLVRDDLVVRVNSSLKAYAIAGNRLEIEITETAIPSSIDQGVMNVFALKALGVSVAIDDYGAGYSNLAQLHNIPADILKIDRSLVHSIATSKRDAAIVRATIALAHELGYMVIIEGVETKDVLDIVTSWGAEYAQGYFIARPLEADKVLTWLNERNVDLSGVSTPAAATHIYPNHLAV